LPSSPVLPRYSVIFAQTSAPLLGQLSLYKTVTTTQPALAKLIPIRLNKTIKKETINQFFLDFMAIITYFSYVSQI
jgi:hypothetical protein